jgi:hypothetical protein
VAVAGGGLSRVGFLSSFLSLILLKNTLGIQNFRVIFLVIDILTLTFIALIFNFYSCYFYKIFIYFQSHSSILICGVYIFFNLVFILLISNIFS